MRLKNSQKLIDLRDKKLLKGFECGTRELRKRQQRGSALYAKPRRFEHERGIYRTG
jgi:hypothetical protein